MYSAFCLYSLFCMVYIKKNLEILKNWVVILVPTYQIIKF